MATPSSSTRIPGKPALLLALSALLAVGLSACSSMPQRSASQAHADGLVMEQMNSAVQSAADSLALLVRLERGTAGSPATAAPPHAEPGSAYLSATVANHHVPEHVPAMPSAAQPQTPLAKAQAREATQALINYNRQSLATRLKLRWNGDTSDLLRQVASSIGYTYEVSGTGALPEMHIDTTDISAEDALRTIANLIEPSASVHVFLQSRMICLVHAGAPATCPLPVSTSPAVAVAVPHQVLPGAVSATSSVALAAPATSRQ